MIQILEIRNLIHSAIRNIDFKFLYKILLIYVFFFYFGNTILKNLIL